jgi:subtilisin family serine protease
MKTSRHKLTKWLYGAPFALFLLGLVACFFCDFSTEDGEYFSADSLSALKNLNGEYGISVDSLSDHTLPAMNDLFLADLILSDKAAEDDSEIGLIATDGKSGVFLLQPERELSKKELQDAAEKYMDAIPEFDFVEVDQELELYGWPFFWPNWLGADDEDVSLTEEGGSRRAGVARMYAGEEEELVEPVSVAVIDSGIDLEHEIFEGHELLPGWNTITDDYEMYDDVGHGTHIAGIIASELPGVVIAPYKIVDENGGRLSNVVEAFNKAIEDEVDVINTSFGLTSYSYVLEYLVEDAYDAGIVICSAAGNSGLDEAFYPASYDHTVAVGGVDDEGVKMEKSNFGAWVDVAATGNRIRSALPFNSYGYKSGTSQSTAFVSAAVARIMMAAGLENELSFEEILETLIDQGEEIEGGDFDGVAIVE